MMKERDLEKLIDLQVMERATQQVIVNGVPQVVRERFAVLSCPSCTSVLGQFNVSQMSVPFLNKYFTSNVQEIEGNLGKYCKTCGQKLSYLRGEMFDEYGNIIG